VRKIGHIDLMRIADPNKKARKPLNSDFLTFRFFTIERTSTSSVRATSSSATTTSWSCSRSKRS